MSTEIVNPNAQGFSLQWPSVEEAQAFAVAAAGGGAVTWKPGAVSGGGIFGTWAEVYAQLPSQTGSGLRFLFVDTSLGAAVVPAGTYDMSNVIVVGRAVATSVVLSDGVVFTELFLEAWKVAFSCLASAGAHYSVPTGATRFVSFRFGASLSQQGAGAFLSSSTGANFIFVVLDFSSVLSLGGAAGPVFSIAAGKTVNVQLMGNAAVGGAGAGGNLTVSGAGTLAMQAWGAVPGVQPLPQLNFTGTLQWQQSATKHLFFAGVCTAAALAAGAYFSMGNPADVCPAAAPFSWEVGDVRYWQRMTVRVLANANPNAVTLDWLVNGAPVAGLRTTVPAGSPAGTVVQGPRFNTASGTAGAAAAVDLRALGGGAGNITLSVTMEYV